MKKISIHMLVLIIGAIILIGGSFYGGVVYAKSGSKSQTGGASAQFRQGMMGGAGAGGTFFRGNGAGGKMVGGFTTGQVVSKTDNGFTVKLNDGGSKVVIVASSTTVGKISQGSMNDVTDGTDVVVTGTANSDGSITASTVQIRPAGEAFPFMGGAQRQGGQAPTGTQANQ